MLAAVKSSAAPAAPTSEVERSSSSHQSSAPESTSESQVIRQQTDEPTAENPILYCEAAYAVRPGVTRAQAERALLHRFQKVCAELDRKSSKKFVQLAIFDHQYAKRPVRAPLATLTWKDWRGAPVLGFPAFGEKAASGSMAPPPDWDKSSGVAVSMPVTAPEHSVPRTSTPASVPPAKPLSVPPSGPAVQVIRSVPVGEIVSAVAPQIPKAAPPPAIAEHPADAEPTPMPSATPEPAVSAPATETAAQYTDAVKAAPEEMKSAPDATSVPPSPEQRQTLPAPEGISTAPAPAPEPSPTIPAEERASAKLTVAPQQPAPEEEAPKAAPSTSDEAPGVLGRTARPLSKPGKSKGPQVELR